NNPDTGVGLASRLPPCPQHQTLRLPRTAQLVSSPALIVPACSCRRAEPPASAEAAGVPMQRKASGIASSAIRRVSAPRTATRVVVGDISSTVAAPPPPVIVVPPRTCGQEEACVGKLRHQAARVREILKALWRLEGV